VTTRRMELRDRSRDEAGIVIRAAAEDPGAAVRRPRRRLQLADRDRQPAELGLLRGGQRRRVHQDPQGGRRALPRRPRHLAARGPHLRRRPAPGEDDLGLAVDADLDTEVSYVRDLVRNVEKRRITGMSFGFQVVKDSWSTEEVETNDGNSAEVEIRTIQEVRLFEVSAVTFPAYEETDAALRALALRDDPDPLGRRAHLIDRITAAARAGWVHSRAEEGRAGSGHSLLAVAG
jgi:hypothetical protein